EVPGILRDPTIKPWAQVDLANAAFGQGVAVTPIQLATAYSALVNGGVLVKPHVVAGVGDREQATEAGSQVISADMSRQMTDLMYHVVHRVPPVHRLPVRVPCATLARVTNAQRVPRKRARQGAEPPVDAIPASLASSPPHRTEAVSTAFSAGELASLTTGRLLRTSSRPMRGAAVDSRLVRPGELFAALPGERTDGHRFLADAVKAGAAGLLVSEAPSPAQLDSLGDVSVVLLPDVTAGL